LAVAQHLPQGRYQAGDRHLNFHETRDNLATGATFDSLLAQASGPVAVEFMSYGCAHCRALEPIVQEVAEDIAATETVFRVNIAIDDDLAKRYDVQGTPTFVLFLNGREIGRSEGPRPTMSAVQEAMTEPFARLGI
jgi:thioredoxin 1